MGATQVLHIGQYRLLNIVYTGQTSRTWQAYDDRERRFVGIKTLLRSTSRDRSQVNMMKWEFKVGAQIHHERIVNIYEFGWYNKIPYIVMEWIPAPNIKQYIQRRYEKYCIYLPSMLPQMVEALAVLHEAGWVHRDIKPDNFIFSEKGEIGRAHV